jgi:hypothetical protein
MRHGHGFTSKYWIPGGILLLFLFVGAGGWWMLYRPAPSPDFGITFSSVYAHELGLDAQDTFRALAQEVGVKFVRLPLYWNEIEKERGEFDWQETDALMKTAEDFGMQVTLAIGQKVPRWPECHIPSWALSLSNEERTKAFLSYASLAVERYRSSLALVRWQVENEPLFEYGVCPQIDPRLLEETLSLVRAKDDRPVQLTVSGELEAWWPLAHLADVLGFSLYQVTWSDTTGYFVYPLPPMFYRLRAMIASWWTDQVIVSELQAEPWFLVPLSDRPLEEWEELFDESALRDRVHFAEEIGVSEVYLWGAEWWYFLHQNGFDGLWNEAKLIFKEGL